MILQLNKGLNFIITSDVLYQEKMQKDFYGKDVNGKISIENEVISFDYFKKNVFWVNNHEKSFFKRRRKYKKMIRYDSEIVSSLEIPQKVFEMQLRHLWHWSFLCSCAIGISKGKKIFVFPWINSGECSVQTYRFLKLSEYALTNNLTVLIPTDDLSRLENNKDPKLSYKII